MKVSTPAALLRLRLVRVSGQSMTPTLLGGDVILVRLGAPARGGDVVLARFRSRPELVVVKRAAARSDDGWSLLSDNYRAGADYGVADVIGVATRVWSRGRPFPTGLRGRPVLPEPPVG